MEPWEWAVTIIQRKLDRRILNIEELTLTLEREGYNNTHVVDMATLSIKEQMQLARCSDVLIGIQGAALHWGFFMRPGTGFVEIAWPQKLWGFYYIPKLAYKIRVFSLTAHHLFLNYACFAEEVKKHQDIVLNWAQIRDFAQIVPLDSWINNPYLISIEIFSG